MLFRSEWRLGFLPGKGAWQYPGARIGMYDSYDVAQTAASFLKRAGVIGDREFTLSIAQPHRAVIEGPFYREKL